MVQSTDEDHAGAMNTTPPEGAQDETTDGPTGYTGGPRVTGDQLRDLARIHRTVGPQRRLAGVAGGIARHLDIDPLLVRVLFFVTSFFGGAGIVAYLGCWLVIPEDTGRTVFATRDRTRTVAILALALVSGLLVLDQVFGANDLWPLMLLVGVGGVVVLLARQDNDDQPPLLPLHRTVTPRYPDGEAPPPTKPGASEPDEDVFADPTYQGYPGDQEYQGYPGYQGYQGEDDVQPITHTRVVDPRKRGPLLFWVVLAAMILGWGVLGLVDVVGVDVPFAAYPALGIALIGGGLLLGSTWGRAGGLIALGLLMLPPLVFATTVDRWEDRTTIVAPDRDAVLAPTYSHPVGDYTLDLSRVDPDNLGRPLRVEVGAGEVTVIVPDEVTVSASAQIGLGTIDLFGDTTDEAGARIERSDGGTGDTELDLDVQLGIGDINVVREGEQR